MKTIDLNNYGVQELNAVEMKETNGGGIISFLVTVVVGGLIYDIVSNPKDTADTFSEAYNNYQPK